MKRFALPAVILTALAATSVGASTISPSDFGTILTEDGRDFTIDGASIAGNAAETGNPDIETVRINGFSAGDTALLSGRTLEDDKDRWVFNNISGLFTVDLLNIAGSTAAPRGPFSTRFDIRVDGNRVDREDFSTTTLGALPQSLFELELTDAHVVIVALDRGGPSDYDLGVGLTAVPLPASSLLLLGGLAGFGAMSRRKRRT